MQAFRYSFWRRVPANDTAEYMSDVIGQFNNITKQQVCRPAREVRKRPKSFRKGGSASFVGVGVVLAQAKIMEVSKAEFESPASSRVLVSY